MNKTLAAIATSIAALVVSGAVQAQVSKAASEATDSAKHKINQKRADDEAKKSGPVGKVVNGVKSDYHKNRSEASAGKAKKSLKDAL